MKTCSSAKAWPRSCVCGQWGELGQDYLKAGLLDRAESVFGKLLETPQHGTARKYLLEIFVQEKDWEKAIEAAISWRRTPAGR
jgi:lipopolysaccharide biosynthesis regulator YciM